MKLLISMGLAGLCSAAMATPLSVSFQFDGAISQDLTPISWPGDVFSIDGSFVGDDANGDGMITADELSSAFVWGDRQAFPVTTLPGGIHGSHLSGGVGPVQYDIANNRLVRFYGWGYGNDDGNYSINYSAEGSFPSSASVAWPTVVGTWDITGPGATLVVSALPVPEPASVALMAAGLGLLAALRRHRSR